MIHQPTPDFWIDAQRRLENAQKCLETDELIDALALEAFESPTEAATPALIHGLAVASSSLTKKSVSLAIAVSAPSGTVAAVDVLVEAFGISREDEFLGPAMLDSLFLFGCRDSLGLTELSSLLQRIDKHANQHLVMKAASLCGHLLQTGQCSELHDKLVELADSPHEEAANDARFYLACLETNAIVSADDRSSLGEALRKSATTFLLAEPRQDALAMRRLLELFLTFVEGGDNNAQAAEVSTTRAAFSRWPGYESPDMTFFLDGVERAIDALEVAKTAVDEAKKWLDIQAGLISLGRALDCLSTCGLGDAFTTLESDLSEIGRKIVRPRVGRVLQKAIGRERLEAAVSACESSDSGNVLRDLLALLDLGDSDPQLKSGLARDQLDRIEVATGRDPEEVIALLESAVSTGRVGPLVESLVPAAGFLAIHGCDRFGDDPTVHRTTCRLLENLRDNLAPYDVGCWHHLRLTVASLVSFTYYVRDVLPKYCLCQEDGGMGQSASESDLQEDVFRWLRMRFGTQSVFETGPVAGGRTDSGIRFADVEFPIELKHEFQHVDRKHIREDYLCQPSDYAVARGRVTFLLILDLRADNAVGHKGRVKAAKKANKSVSARALYTLNDSFWCEILPTDPEIESAERCVVVVGIVPGNRPKPSSQTTYSERPKSARKSAKKAGGNT